MSDSTEPEKSAPTDSAPAGPPIGRKHPAHGVLRSDKTPTIVFVTICTKDRRPWLACDEAHQLIREAWMSADAWLVGRYVLMPDHLHFFCGPTTQEMSLENWIRFWKSRMSTSASITTWRWQSDHWDTRLRQGDNYSAKWNYVRENPVRAGVINTADDWPYQGELHTLNW